MNAADVKRVTILSCISSAATLHVGSGDVEAVLKTAEVFYAQAMGASDQLDQYRAREREAVLSA